MILNFILLMTPECRSALLMGLALCFIPFLLGWLAAYTYYKVSALRDRNAELEAEVKRLNGSVSTLTAEGTDLRVKLTQADAHLEERKGTISKLRSDFIILESERNTLRDAAALAAGATMAHAEKITFNGVVYKWDDLKIVEGIGPKIEELLHAAGIKTWHALANTAEAHLVQIIDDAGPRFQMHNPATWAEQSRMADASEWDALKKYQDELTAGRA